MKVLGRPCKHTFQDTLDHGLWRPFESVFGVVRMIAASESAPATRVGAAGPDVDDVVVVVGGEDERGLDQRRGVVHFEGVPALPAV